MRHQRLVLSLTTGGLFLALASGCASTPKTARPSTEVIDGAAAAAPVARPEPVAAPPAEPQAPACSLARVHFAFDSSQLDETARAELKQAAACLQQRRPADLVVEGHCDERGTAAYNMALGHRRAGAVKAYLGDLGVQLPMQAISFGKELPLVKGEGEAAWSQNRRAELRLPGERRTDGALVAER
ncbi:MAG: OmpA family protein [Anaeromyxobacteraceae bacterium]|nr:OmpA family protein [Anaeromyxobacteraceae bacterium]